MNKKNENNKKIGLFYDDSNKLFLDGRHPEKGNPGCGGTQYEFLLLVYALKKYTDLEIIFFHTNNNILIPNCNANLLVSDIFNAIEKCKENNIEQLIYNFMDNNKIYEYFERMNVWGIAWAHNFFNKDAAVRAYHAKYLKKIVCVGKQQYDVLVDDDIYEKCTYIFNMAALSEMAPKMLHDTKSPIVVYVGALIEAKGFHILAKNWKKILNKIPEAELYVIGSGNLYSDKSKLGKYGIAEENYEKIFIPYLLTEGKIDSSVHFFGNLGEEKSTYIKNAAVGIINPSGKTETFGISAAEILACGVPVILNRNKFLYMIENNRNGYLYRTQGQMRRKIVKALRERNSNIHMRESAVAYVNKFFSPEVVVKNWESLLHTGSVDLKHCEKNLSYRFSVVNLVCKCNWFLRKCLRLKWLPSVWTIRSWLRN